MRGRRKKRGYLPVLFEMDFDDVLVNLTCWDRCDFAIDCQPTLSDL
jgi:hypothetical protein